MLNTNICGINRVVDQHVLPVYAWRLNNSLPIEDDELLVDVKKIHMENACFDQVFFDANGDETKIKQTIYEIVEQRGKMHNPYTHTAGILAGFVKQIGTNFENKQGLKLGDPVLIPVSASLIPLSLNKITSINYDYGIIDVCGYSIIYNNCPIVKKPDDIPWDLFLVAFEESSSTEKARQLCMNQDNVLIFGSNPIVSILYGLAAKSAMRRNGTLSLVFHGAGLRDLTDGRELTENEIKNFFTSIYDEIYFFNKFEHVSCVEQITQNNTRLFDVVISTAEQIGSEAISILSTKPHGTVFFSGLSNAYVNAIYFQEAIDRDMNILCSVGFVEGYYESLIDFLKTYKNDIIRLSAQLDLARNLQNENSARLDKQHNLTTKLIEEHLNLKSLQDRDLVNDIEKSSKYDCPIVIEGESGSGKEVLADLIHNMSNRKFSPMIKVNCAAIPKDLMESEFLGYEKGAFTGANDKGKKGFFELADEGTIFLDEIGEIPLEYQAKLLRVIQSGEFYRVGGQIPIKVNVRIIAATNKNLWQMVEAGTFRKDLYYRLAVISLLIPPLRERQDDIKYLAEKIMQKLNGEYSLNKTITKGALALLAKYDWPGNIRELENTLQRLYINSSTDSILSADIINDFEKRVKTKNLLSKEPEFLLKYLDSDNSSNITLSYNERVENFEKQIISDALEKYGSSYKSAKALNMTQSQFMRKKKKFNL